MLSSAEFGRSLENYFWVGHRGESLPSHEGCFSLSSVSLTGNLVADLDLLLPCSHDQLHPVQETRHQVAIPLWIGFETLLEAHARYM